MTFIKENIEVFMVAGFFSIVVLLLIVLRFNFYLSKFFSNKKFKVYSTYTYEPTNSFQSFKLNIFNNNVNDSRIIAFGYIYKNHSIDYYKTYLKNNSLPADSKLIISSRDCITSDIEVSQLKTIVSDMNRGKRKVHKICSFVSDASGMTFKSKAYSVSKQISIQLNNDYLDELAKKRILKQKMKEEKKAFRRKVKIEKRLKRKELYEKWKLRLKSIFHIKKSS